MALRKVVAGLVSAWEEDANFLAASVESFFSLERSGDSISGNIAGISQLVGKEQIFAQLTLLIEKGGDSFVTIRPNAPTEAIVDQCLPRDLEIVGRYSRSSFIFNTDAGKESHIKRYARETAKKGAVVKLSQYTPFQVVIVDSVTAMLTSEYVGDQQSALLVTQPSIIEALNYFFADLWRDSTDIFDNENSIPIDTKSKQILQALYDGLTDEAISRALGVSAKTIGRKIAHLSRRVGAQSRFALGAESVKRGWLLEGRR
jgi:DNA-binding NarL/FixJ family response regulator